MTKLEKIAARRAKMTEKMPPPIFGYRAQSRHQADIGKTTRLSRPDIDADIAAGLAAKDGWAIIVQQLGACYS